MRPALEGDSSTGEPSPTGGINVDHYSKSRSVIGFADIGLFAARYADLRLLKAELGNSGTTRNQQQATVDSSGKR